MESLLIFIKNPREGKVKTRLAASIGNNNALKIYHHLLDHTLKISSELDTERFLFYDESINVNDKWSNEHFLKYLQEGENLGTRMFNAFQTAFSLGSNKVIIIGSDCPGLNSSDIRFAFAKLDQHDFVIGPALDGGYYLLGMKYPEEKLFKNKTWSTSTVASETIKDIKSLQKSVFILPELTDIDTEEDLNQELKELIK